jgi:acyl-CoA dehydrogenase
MEQDSMIPAAGRLPFDDDHALFRDSVRRFMEREVLPYNDHWEAAGIVDRAFWTTAGAAGLLCPTVPPEYEGLGLDFGHNAVSDEELAYAGASAGTTLQSDITADYILGYGSEAQKRYWLPRMISGKTITAIAMTEPGTGSDLKAIRITARRDGDEYVINGAKTYITNGQHCDIVILAAKTDPAAGARGPSLILVESDRAGFDRGRNLDKIGQYQADTFKLFFNEVRVPASNLLGSEGAGFSYLMAQLPQERLAIAAMGNSQRASYRIAEPDRRHVPATPRRLRLYQRISDRPAVARRARHRHLWRHVGNHERSHSTVDLSAGLKGETM